MKHWQSVFLHFLIFSIVVYTPIDCTTTQSEQSIQKEFTKNQTIIKKKKTLFRVGKFQPPTSGTSNE